MERQAVDFFFPETCVIAPIKKVEKDQLVSAG
jgi:hypothetical protein